MRDNFPKTVKKKLAERVAWRCSFPGCGRLTVGPGHASMEDTVNVGEAAHIYASSKGGPRYNPEMTSQERKSINNGIWLCRQHSKLIDNDYTNYSAATIRQWKVLAEQRTYQELKEISKRTIDVPLTLVGIGNRIIFEGIWKSVNNCNWTFTIDNFIIGDIDCLKEFSLRREKSAIVDYIVVESQGDGRLLAKDFGWTYVDSKYEVYVSVQEKQPRENPYNVGEDIALSEDGDLKFEDGDFKIISGIECAQQLIVNTLSTGFGELFYNPTIGSHFSNFYWKFKDDLILLNRLLKLEITRLVSIPIVTSNKELKPPLNFINRVIDVDIVNIERSKHRIPISLKLEWGNGDIWENTIQVYIHDEDSVKDGSKSLFSED
jgi:hypothetical protein